MNEIFYHFKPHVDADYGIKLLNRLKSTDEAVFGECMKALLSYKNLDITIDNLIVKLEEILADLPDSLDDFLLFLDYKRVFSHFFFLVFICVLICFFA